MSQVTPTAIAEPLVDRERYAYIQRQFYEGILRILENSSEESLYLKDMRDIHHFTFMNSREIGILLFIYHNMIQGKDRPAEVKECMTEHEWEQFQLNRDILIATFFTLFREEEEEEMSKKWWYRILQFFRIRSRTTILPESYFIR